jgi:uncharacterized cupredoxin-like copper-binding protein
MNQLFGAAAAAALALLAPAAFADAGHMHALGKPGEAKNVTRTLEVTMNDQMRYSPASIQLKRHETIRFIVKNVGEMKHEMVLGTDQDLKAHAVLMQKFPEMEHDDPNAVAVEPGKTGEMIWQFTRAGNFKFACLQPGHYEAGMVGKVTVQQAQK